MNETKRLDAQSAELFEQRTVLKYMYFSEEQFYQIATPRSHTLGDGRTRSDTVTHGRTSPHTVGHGRTSCTDILLGRTRSWTLVHTTAHGLTKLILTTHGRTDDRTQSNMVQSFRGRGIFVFLDTALMLVLYLDFYKALENTQY